jgi:hypothetical protein
MSSVVQETHMRFAPSRTRVRAEFAGEIVADSVRTLILNEGRMSPVVYFPREDVRIDLPLVPLTPRFVHSRATLRTGAGAVLKSFCGRTSNLTRKRSP